MTDRQTENFGDREKDRWPALAGVTIKGSYSKNAIGVKKA